MAVRPDNLTPLAGETQETGDCEDLAFLLLRQQLSVTCIRGFSGSARRRVVEWLVDMMKEERENMDMVALTVALMDILSMRVKRNQLQLLAGAALLLASKARDRSLSLERIILYMDHAGHRETVLVWEKLILLKIKFNISLVVPHDFLPPLLSLFSHIIPSPLSYVSLCCSQLLSLSCMEQKLSICLPSLQASAAIYLTLETDETRKTFLAEVERSFNQKKDDILSCSRIMEDVLIRTLPEERGENKSAGAQERRHRSQTSAPIMGRSRTILTPQKSEFVLSQISIHSSTPKKSFSKLKFLHEYVEDKENDDSAIALETSLLCLSSPPSSSSSTKSSPDSGASVSSYRARF